MTVESSPRGNVPVPPGPGTQVGGLRRRLLAARSERMARIRSTVLPPLALVALVAYFAADQSSFLSSANITVMLSQGGPLLILSLGATFVVLGGSIDLSVGATAALGAAVSADLFTGHGFGAWCIVGAIVAGMAVGLVNGLCVTRLKLPSFIVTLAMLSLCEGATLTVLHGQALLVSGLDQNLSVGQLIPDVPNVALIGVCLWAILVLVNTNTRFGRYITAIGAGEPIAALSGVPVQRYKLAAFVVSGAFAGVAGHFLLLQLGSASSNIEGTFLLDSIAAIVIGGTALMGGVGGIHRTLLGVAVLTVLDNGLNVAGVSTYTQLIIKGIVVILAVMLTIDRERMQRVVK